MATNTISYAGNVLSCTVERFPEIKKAQRKFRQYNIPGRNGDVFFQDDAYENVIQSYQVYAGDDTDGQAQADWTTLAAQLYKDGYQVLEDSYDTDHFRKAVFNGPIDVENSWNTHGRATLEFNCRPERFLKSGNTPITYEHQTASVHWMAWDDLSEYIRTSMFSGVETDGVFVVSFPASGSSRTVTLNWIDDGNYKKIASISPGTEATANYGTTMNTRWNTYNLGISAQDWLIPDIYYDGNPVIEIDGVAIGSAGVLVNNYMPSYPTIMLHNVAAYSGEEMVLQINNKTVYIEYQSGTPYYFIDTENASVTCAATLDGERGLANNVYISADFRLQHGDNNIFTTEYYDVTITPNWWEL